MTHSAALSFASAPISFIGVFCLSRAAAWLDIPMAGCIAKLLFGVRCPGCGITTSITALMRGDFTGAVAANVAGPIVAAYFLVQLGCFAAAVCEAPQQVLFRFVRQSDRVLLAGLTAAWLWHFIH